MIELVTNYLRDLIRWVVTGWNRFWFTPEDPATLSVIRILAGGMLFYTHLVWSRGLEDFFSATSWISPEAALEMHGDNYPISYFWLINSPAGLWAVHIVALAAMLCLTLGLFTRPAAIVSWIAAISYVNRVPLAQFGLDQLNTMLCLYLIVGPSGACYSLDRWREKRNAQQKGWAIPPVRPSVSANIAIRLMQFHMCVIYFAAGLGKAQGESWWSGTAMWWALGNLEYQSMDLTWIAAWPLLTSLLTHATVFWELTFPVFVWNPKLRPLVIGMAIPVHLGIAFFMGMITFGLVMLFGCMSFVSPKLVRMVLDRAPAEQGRAGGEAPSRQTAQTRPISRRPAPVARATKRS